MLSPQTASLVIEALRLYAARTWASLPFADSATPTVRVRIYDSPASSWILSSRRTISYRMLRLAGPHLSER